MPPQVRRAKVRDKQTPLSEIHIIPLHIFTCIGYIHVHCASVGKTYTVAIIGKSSKKIFFEIIGNTSIDTCV